MGTFMTRQTFDQLAEIRRLLITQLPVTEARTGHPSYIFAPWAGSLLAQRRGIYFIGIALAAEPFRGSERDFDQCVESTFKFISDWQHEKANTPFWRFFDRITLNLLGQHFEGVSDRWGWSNLLKIHWSESSPSTWPPELIQLQRGVCREALREEFSQLHESLVFVGSASEFGILWPVVGDEHTWNKEHQDRAGIWWLQENRTGNLFIKAYHPNYAQQQNFSDAVLDVTLELAGTHLASFG